MNEVVRLNVGGEAKDYRRGKLCQAQDSLLAKFFMRQNIHNLLPVGADGKFFIDRDPRAFQLMMNYLANGAIDKSKMAPLTRDLYQKELDFWGVERFHSTLNSSHSLPAAWGSDTFRTVYSGTPKRGSDHSPGSKISSFNNPNRPVYTIGGSN